MAEHCPTCRDGLLEFIEGSFGTGVFHPDGGQETLYGRFYGCDRCGRKFDEDDLDDLRVDEEQDEDQ